MKRVKTFIYWIFLSLFSLTYHSKRQSNKLSHLKNMQVSYAFFIKNLKVSWLSFKFSHNGPKNNNLSIQNFRTFFSSLFKITPRFSISNVMQLVNLFNQLIFPSVKERRQIPGIENHDIKCCNLTRTLTQRASSNVCSLIKMLVPCLKCWYFIFIL